MRECVLGIAALACSSVCTNEVSAQAGSADRHNSPILPLPQARGWNALLERSALAFKPVVVLWGTPGCHWCNALRQEVMIHIWREAASRNLEVIEFDLSDITPLPEETELSAALLARRFGVRVSPTVSFHGPSGELAERLVGYPSRDFYLSYFEQRLEMAQRRLRRT